MEDRELARATSRVGEIVAAAEQAAEGMRLEAERRLRERIAEGDRAAANRIEAAEAEALEILANAQAEAEKIRETAEATAKEIRDEARVEARQIVAEASGSAREVLRDGTELSGNLRELSDSLRTNAELLLRDVRLAHAEMTARLDQLEPADSESARLVAAAQEIDELDVPEFHPGRR
jgi:cell division septum initiation protein DivIVA